MKQDIRDFTPAELLDKIKALSEPQYRAKQTLRWLYRAGATSFDQMKDIPLALREKLSQRFQIYCLKMKRHLVSQDKTEKLAYELSDGNLIETVLIPAPKRETVCVSTQIGCKYTCAFCASGAGGFVRNLAPSEITSQVLFLKHNLGKNITNVVFMGIGEPLDNFDNVATAVTIMNSKDAMNIASRRITISTCGIVPGILRLKDLGLQINLSISLHAVNDRLRSRLMPVNKKYPIKAVIDAALDYFNATKRKVFLDYILFKDINDSREDAEGLAAISKRLGATVNLIEYHTRPGQEPLSPGAADIRGFMDYLKKKRVTVTLRTSRGLDILAGCGQLCGMAN